MKALSDTLAAMKSPASLQRAASLGSTATDGHTNISLPTRKNPLTGDQITAIASQTLRAPLRIISEIVPIYGRKTIDGFTYEDQKLGEQERLAVVAIFAPDAPRELINAALAASPPEACLKHLTHLALHKRIGSGDADRKVLLRDYTQALASIPEFVLAAVVQAFIAADPRERQHRAFYPRIDEIRDACDDLAASLERARNPPPKIPRRAPETESDWTPPTEEEKAQVSAMVAEFVKQVNGGNDEQI